MTSLGIPLVSISGMVAFVVGCTSREEGARSGAGTAQPHVVTLTATNYAFQAPDTIPAGWTTFQLVNHGATIHSAQLVKLEAGRTLEDFLKAYDKAWRTVGPRPAWGIRIGGPGATEPNGSSNATMYLEPGSYAWYCPMNMDDGVPHFLGKGMARPFVVKPRGGEATSQTVPEPTITIRLADYTFSLSDSLTAGRHVIRVENRGPEPHEAGLVKLAPGKTMEDFQAWAREFQGPPPVRLLGGVNALAANTEAYFEADLTPGDYVLLCFVTAPDGRPHVAHGMIQHIRIA